MCSCTQIIYVTPCYARLLTRHCEPLQVTDRLRMSFDELKQKGNDCIRQRNYTEAIEFYTKALGADPSSHALYSNRSLAYSSIGDFERALQDATKCLDLAPTFARGYLRKAVALIGLMKYKEAMVAAQEGYKLRGSDAISRDCVAQWVKANQAIHRPLVEQKLQGELDLLPRGCLVLSEEYLDVFLDALIYRVQLTNEMEPVVMNLHRTFIELDHVLHLFGHSPCPCQRTWVECLYAASKMNPSTARVPVDTVTALLAKSDEFATWLHTSVDPTLYPVICPIISLAVITVTVRSISLNVVNSDQHANQVACRACLPFLEKSVLSSERYAEQLLGIYKEFLEAWASIAVKFTAEEVLFLEQSIKKVEEYVKRCPKQLESYKETTMVSIALARIRLGKEPGFDPVSCAPEHGKAVSRLVERSPEELTAYVKERLEELEAAARAPLDSPIPFAAQDAQDVLFCIGGLLKVGKQEMAVEAFQLAESTYLRLLQDQITSNNFSLDEAGMMFHTAQSLLLMNVAAFLGTEDNLVADALTRWKCIYSEFRTILVRFGIGYRYLQTFKAVEQMSLTGQQSGNDAIMQLAEEHKEEVNRVVGEVGQQVLLCLLRQSYGQIQSILEPDQLVLEYRLDEREGESSDPQARDGFLVMLQPEGDPLVRRVDFQNVFPVAKKWADMLSKVTGQQACEEAALDVARDLSKLLLPPEVCEIIGRPEVKRVFICPDGVLGVLPLELLPLEDGKLLTEKCSTVYLSSSRELLRELIIVAVSKAQEISGFGSNPLEESVSRDCVVFANPNFNLEKPSSEIDSGFWESVVSGFASFFSSPSPEAAMAPMLPGSQKEADEICAVLSCADTPLVVSTVFLNDATLKSALEVKSPFILHFSTHGFSSPRSRGVRSSFWDDTETGLLLAGANTYRAGKLKSIHLLAGTGTLTSLAACGMKLDGTRLVYLSACVTSHGFYSYGEAINSLAHAFRSAGAQTVIATLWPLVDNSAASFAHHFYQEVIKPDMPPSLALAYAKVKMRTETSYDHWAFWGAFICIGQDKPLFPTTCQ